MTNHVVLFFFTQPRPVEEAMEKMGEMTIEEAKDDEILFDKVQSNSGLVCVFFFIFAFRRQNPCLFQLL